MSLTEMDDAVERFAEIISEGDSVPLSHLGSTLMGEMSPAPDVDRSPGTGAEKSSIGADDAAPVVPVQPHSLSDLPFLPLVEIADLIRRRDVSPVELCEQQLARIAEIDPSVGAFITVAGELANEQARAAEREVARGDYRGQLHGIPVSLKDTFATAGVRTTLGSRLHRDNIPDRDAVVWQRLRAAGAVLLGKNNLSEFAYSVSLVNEFYGATRNPWDLARTTSGSSSGSAAAVSAGMSYLSVGAECGASVQRPASFCGVVGFKGSYGRVGLAGDSPTSLTMDHVGTLTRSVKDAAVAFDLLSAHGGSRDAARALAGAGSGPTMKGLRLGILRRHLEGQVDDEVAKAFWRAIDECRRLGATIVEAAAPSVDYAGATSVIIRSAEASAHHARALREHPGGYSEALRHELERGLKIPAAYYVRAQLAREVIIRETSALFDSIDLLAAPTAALAPPLITAGLAGLGDHPWCIGSNHYNVQRLFTLTGLPSITVPCGFTPDGLPVGLQFGGQRWDESTVIAAAAEYEDSSGWSRRSPPLARADGIDFSGAMEKPG